jgi:histidinol-phosphate/aromatic aminotransferase/cobyric acid decarboxylase-like protein
MNNNQIDANAFWHKLTKPIRDPYINQLISQLDVEQVSHYDKQFSFAERLATKQKFIIQFCKWTSPFFSGLTSFSEKYICNGNTDAINHVFLQKKFNKVYTLDNEYSYYGYLCQQLSIPKIIFTVDDIDKITQDDIVFISVPNSYNGTVNERTKIIDLLQEKNINLFIDVAYCGLTTPFHLAVKNASNTVFSFSFSKTLGLSFNRIAVCLANKPIPGLEIMNRIGYVNLSGARLAGHIMQNVDCDYIYKKYHYQYKTICDSKQLTMTECMLFAHDVNKEKYCITDQYALY